MSAILNNGPFARITPLSTVNYQLSTANSPPTASPAPWGRIGFSSNRVSVAPSMSEPSTSDTLPALGPVGGLVLATNHKGEPAGETTLRQWMRLSAEKFHVQKVDVRLPDATSPQVLPLLAEAKRLNVRLALRTTQATKPDVLAELAPHGLLDLALEVTSLQAQDLDPWLVAAEEANLTCRLLLNAADLPDTPDPALLAQLTWARVVTIQLAGNATGAQAPLPEHTLARVATWTTALIEQGATVRCLGVPFCLLPESCWPAVYQGAQERVTPHGYNPAALDFANRVMRLPAHRIEKAVEITLGQGSSFHSLVDNTVLPWILERPRFFFWLWFLHKLTRRLPWRRHADSPIPGDLPAWEAQLAAYREAQKAKMGPACATCRLHPICDHHTEHLKQAFPGLAVRPQPGEPVCDPRFFLRPDRDSYDAVDSARLDQFAERGALADRARHRIARETPTREIPAESYEIDGHQTHRMPASIRWFSFSTAPLQSTVLARVAPPFTISVTVGGGIAEYMGFALGRHTRLLCPMTAYSHRLTLHVEQDGHFVLLRDDELVEPVLHTGGAAVPEHIGTIALCTKLARSKY